VEVLTVAVLWRGDPLVGGLGRRPAGAVPGAGAQSRSGASGGDPLPVLGRLPVDLSEDGPVADLLPLGQAGPLLPDWVLPGDGGALAVDGGRGGGGELAGVAGAVGGRGQPVVLHVEVRALVDVVRAAGCGARGVVPGG